MPHFTVFGEENRRHVDVLGVRLKGSEERVGELPLVIDNDFIEALHGHEENVQLWAEVGTGSMSEVFPPEKAKYCQSIFGTGNQLKKVYFDFDDRSKEELENRDGVLVVSAGRCRKLILQRFHQMESTPVKEALKELTKPGSWSWSEEFLADLLYLKKMGFLP